MGPVQPPGPLCPQYNPALKFSGVLPHLSYTPYSLSHISYSSRRFSLKVRRLGLFQ